jgi:protein TonB
MASSALSSNATVNFSSNQPLLIALAVAVVLHLILLLGISLPKPSSEQYINHDIDITLVNAPAQAPVPTPFVAQQDQQAQAQSTPTPPAPPPQQASEQLAPSPKTLTKKVDTKPIVQKKFEPVKPIRETKPIIEPPPEPIKPIPETKRILKPIVKPPEPVKQLEPVKPPPEVKKPPEPIKPVPAKPVITAPEKIEPLLDRQPLLDQQPPSNDIFQMEQPKTKPRLHTELKPREPVRSETHHLSATSLQQQISSVAAAASSSQLFSAPQTKTKSVHQVSANKSVASQYKRDWESKVERVGNLNYPEVASKPNFSATLTMDVGINADGSIASMRITQSSGIPELDEAAKKIVQMSAPFPPLPAALLKELDVLLITRVWKFTDESGLVTQ